MSDNGKSKNSDIVITNDIAATALAENSDFTFEMKVLNRLTGLGFHCEHSGTYVDPIKLRNREFDIRGLKIFDEFSYLHVAVECKNISQVSPLVIHRVPRRVNEAFHNVIIKNQTSTLFSEDSSGSYTPSYIRRLEIKTPYTTQTLSGKAMDQIVPNGRGGVKLSDGEVFDRCSQALSSLSGMFDPILRDIKEDRRHALIPILVVPDGTLWAMDYLATGAPSAKPHAINHIQYFVNKTYSLKSFPTHIEFTASYLDVVTLSGLEGIFAEYCNRYDNYAPLFPEK